MSLHKRVRQLPVLVLLTLLAVAGLAGVATAGQPARSAASTPAARPRPDVALPSTPGVAGKFVPVTPARLLDTRNGTGTAGRIAPIGPDSDLILDVSGVTGDPSIAPAAVVLNVTAVNPTAAGFLTVYGYGQGKPNSSNINFSAGQIVPNLVTVPVATDGKIDFYNRNGNTDVVADVFGYYTTDRSGAELAPLTPARVLDTRSGTGTGGVVAPVGTGGTLSLKVAGVAGVPAANVTAVVLNVTVTNPTAASYLSVYPGGTNGAAAASNLNFVAGQTVPNLVIVPVGQDGTVDFYNRNGSTDVIADISGYFQASTAGVVSHGGVYSQVAAARVLDTRTGTGTGGAVNPVGAGQTLSLPLAGVAGLPAAGVTAVVLNVTVTNPTAASYLSVFPDGANGSAAASNLNYVAGQTVANLVVVPVSAAGKVDFYNRNGSTDVIADVFGYYTTGSGLGISALGFASTSVDASAGNAAVTVNWTVTDTNPNPATVSGDIEFRLAGATPDSYIGQPYLVQYQLNTNFGTHATYVSGDAASSSYTYSFAVPQYAGSSTAHWVISAFTVNDDTQNLIAAGPELNGFAGTLTATELVDSTNQLSVQNITFGSPGVRPYVYDGINTEGSYFFTVQDPAGASSGFWRGTIILAGPGGATLSQRFGVSTTDGYLSSGPCQGQVTNVQCALPVVIPIGAAAGTWVVSELDLTDNAGHTTTLTGLNAAPITVTADTGFTAGGFTATPSVVNDWRSSQSVTLSWTVSGARQGVSAAYVDAQTATGLCTQPSTTVTADPDGSYSVLLNIGPTMPGCVITGIAVVDGAGDAAVYGQKYAGTTDPGVTVTRTPDTTPPSASSASVSPASVVQSKIGNPPIKLTVQAAIGIAPINGLNVYVYDSSGNVIDQETGGAFQAADGTVTGSVPLNSGQAVGTYTVGFVLTDAGGLSTAYGTPNGNPMPGGPLQVSVTAG